MQRLRIKYSKEDPLKYISHLDLVRSWERILRRTSLPLAFSHGFNPKPQVSFGPPLAVGFTSESEYLDLSLNNWEKPDQAKKEIESKLASGIKIFEVKLIAPHEPSLISQIQKAEYICELADANNLEEKIREILNPKELIITKKRKDQPDKKINIRPMIFELEKIQDNRIRALLQCNSSATLRPDHILSFSKIHRTRLL